MDPVNLSSWLRWAPVVIPVAALLIFLWTRSSRQPGRTAEARATVREALEQSLRDVVPQFAEDHYLAGRAMLAIGDHSTAAQYFQQASDLEPAGNFGFLARQQLQELRTPTCVG